MVCKRIKKASKETVLNLSNKGIELLKAEDVLKDTYR